MIGVRRSRPNAFGRFRDDAIHDAAQIACLFVYRELAIRARAAAHDRHAPLSARRAGNPDRHIARAVAIDPLLTYLEAVFDATRQWLDDVATSALDTIPDTSHRLAANAELSIDEVDWLHRMWADKPVWWLVQWPVIGHGHAHVGEAISVRNRMGLSPF